MSKRDSASSMDGPCGIVVFEVVGLQCGYCGTESEGTVNRRIDGNELVIDVEFRVCCEDAGNMETAELEGSVFTVTG